MAVVDKDVRTAVREAEWQASEWFRKECVRRSGHTLLSIRADAGSGERGSESVRDVPASFDPRRREHAWREVVDLPPRRMSLGADTEPDFFATVQGG